MTYIPATDERDMWAIIGGMLATGLAMAWPFRPRRQTNGGPADEGMPASASEGVIESEQPPQDSGD